ncbi:ATP-binding cassette domain-containing protein [Actinoallomurus sp. NPDC052274]|uniref:ATP-binding cassette domain-containing protein n=1 Tax=Actinoallomurus sp. NPDC052274 TaxID=3155420 RepID=UPI003444BF1D
MTANAQPEGTATPEPVDDPRALTGPPASEPSDASTPTAEPSDVPGTPSGGPEAPGGPRSPVPLVAARGLALRGARGWAYRDVDLALPEGGLAVVSGEAGSGRTSLLLTLAGRMRPTSGEVTVAGRSAPAAIQRVAAIGETEGVNELDDALTVAEHVFERRHLRAGLLPRRRAKRSDEVAAALAPVGLDVDPDTPTGDLGPRDRHLLGAALALLDRPRLLVLDDVDRGMRGDHQREMWACLRALTRQAEVTIIASCVDGAAAADLADVEVAL